MSATYLLDKLIEEKKLQREKLRQDMISRTKEALRKLAEFVSFDQAYLFGSLASPYKFFEESDIDIGFIGLKDEEFFTAAAFLSQELGRDVDLIQLEKSRLKKSLKKGLLWKKPG